MSNHKTKNFVNREFEEVEGGYYEAGFYFTPDGSKTNLNNIIRFLG